jgi:glycosyltransferase involved in cell wall biosynthesis
MRILIWHGWLLEGSGSNVAAARISEVLRAAGHDVLLICQERRPERFAWIDAIGVLDGDAAPDLTPTGSAAAAKGRCVLLRPEIGPILPVFVRDPYKGFDDVRRFVDLTDEELELYLARNVDALRAAAAWHRPDVAFVGHVVPGAALGRRSLGPGRYVARVYGSDVEYAIRPQERYRRLAAEGLATARAGVASTRDALDRCAALVPDLPERALVVPPGVDVRAFRPRPRREGLSEAADLVERHPELSRGRPSSIDEKVARALADRDAEALVDLSRAYRQNVPDQEAPARLRALAEAREPIVGYLGKLIPQKGVELMIQALHRLRRDVRGLVVGFGFGREWIEALVKALANEDAEGLAWVRDAGGLAVDPAIGAGARGLARREITFTGMLDHRYAPNAVAAMDVQVVPSILDEAFGIVAAEGAAAGALPLVARHSGLGEVADALEGAVDRPGLFSFEPGPGAVERVAGGIDRLLSLPAEERDELRRGVSTFVADNWTWDRAAERLLAAAGPEPSPQ